MNDEKTLVDILNDLSKTPEDAMLTTFFLLAIFDPDILNQLSERFGDVDDE